MLYNTYMEVKISISSKRGDLVKINEKKKKYSSQKYKLKTEKDKQLDPQVLKEGTNKMLLNKNKQIIEELPEISNKLIDIEVIKYLFSRYKFESFDQAIWILGTDLETKKYNHYFYQISETESKNNINPKSLCSICNDYFEKHEAYYQNINEITNTQETYYRLLNDFENLKEGDDLILKFKNKNKKVEIPKDMIKQLELEFTKDNLCIICYEKELLPETSFSLECKHFFCNNCIKNYFETRINQGNINNFSCLRPGCRKIYGEEIIEKMVTSTVYLRFLLIKKREEARHGLKNGFIPCVFPNCEETVNYKDGQNALVICKNKHRFCAICKEGWHKSSNCKNKNILTVMRSSDKIKMCPQCNMFIEKEDGCNQMKCAICNHEFCWLCLKECEFYHYYVFNIRGCPGMRYAKNKKSSVSDNQCVNFLWYILVIIMSILAIALLVAFFFFFGASYEFIKCYKKSKQKKKQVSEKPTSQSMVIVTREHMTSSDLSSNNRADMSGVCDHWTDILILILLIIIGVTVQPFFLLFKFMEMMMECYRQYGCLFFWFLWGNNN